MFRRLAWYNWTVFRNTLSGTKITVFLIYGLSLLLIFSQVVSSVYLIVTLQKTQLSEMFQWYTPERGHFLLLAFANILWFTQFFFTNVRLLNLNENRKQLSWGYPTHKLSKHLTLLAFLHPLNLLFNLSWLSLLMLQWNSIYYLPLALGLVMLNFSIIFSAKFRVLTVIKSYQKWLLLLVLTLLITVSAFVESLLSSRFFTNIEQYIPILNNGLSLLPGGIISSAHLALSSLPLQLAVLFFCGILSLLLHRDHIYNTRRTLQTWRTSHSSSSRRSWFQNWLCKQTGNHAGKYLYYVITHPYNKIQALLFVVFPILYVPYMVSRMDQLGNSKFLVLFFFMYAPMGFLLMFLGNMFGYEHRELLRSMQFPKEMKTQLRERLRGALIIPLTLLVIISGAEVIILIDVPNLLSIVLGNILIFLVFLRIFLWSTFNRLRVVEWISFSFTQPVISHSVQFVSGLLMMGLSATVYISYGQYELYKQLAMLVLIIVLSLGIYRYIVNIYQLFSTKVIPFLWNER
jgi:hypothetical protein